MIVRDRNMSKKRRIVWNSLDRMIARNGLNRMIARNCRNSCTNMISKIKLMLASFLDANISTGSECFLRPTANSAYTIWTHSPVIASCISPL